MPSCSYGVWDQVQFKQAAWSAGHSIVPYIHEVSPFKFRFQVHIYAHFKNARERLPGCLSSPHCVCAFTRIAEPTFGKIKRRLQIFQMKIKILPSSKCNNRGERKTHASTLFLSSYKAEWTTEPTSSVLHYSKYVKTAYKTGMNCFQNTIFAWKLQYLVFKNFFKDKKACKRIMLGGSLISTHMIGCWKHVWNATSPPLSTPQPLHSFPFTTLVSQSWRSSQAI